MFMEGLEVIALFTIGIVTVLTATAATMKILKIVSNWIDEIM